jgi:hypothetical protein
MLTVTKKMCAATLGLMLLFAVASSANAQSFGGRLSTGQKIGAIGGGAAAGAVIGGLLGGKKGAIIGGALGAVGGTAYVATQGRDYDRYGRYDRDYDRYGRYDRDRYYWDGRRWVERRAYNDRWDRDHDGDYDRDDRRGDWGRNRWGYNRFHR